MPQDFLYLASYGLWLAIAHSSQANTALLRV
jgi:hypothetical protein